MDRGDDAGSGGAQPGGAQPGGAPSGGARPEGAAAGQDGPADGGGAPVDPVGPVDAVEEAVARVRAGLDDLAGARLWARSDGQSRDLVVAVAELAARVEAVYLRAVGDLDSRPDAVAGARSGAVARTFLTHRVRVASGRAGADVAAAHALDPENGALTGLGVALAEGRVSRAHVDVGVRAVRHIPRHLLEQVGPDGETGAQVIDRLVTDHAHAFCPETTRKLTAHLLHAIDPDRTDRFDPDAYTRRQLRMGTDSTGMLVGSFQLDPAAGAVVRTALQRYGRPAPATDAVTPDGEQTRLHDERDGLQRNADALATIARIALGHAPNHHPRPDTDGGENGSTGGAEGSGTQGSGTQGSGSTGVEGSARSGDDVGIGAGERGTGESAGQGSTPATRPVTHITILATLEQLRAAGPAQPPSPGAPPDQTPARSRGEPPPAGLAECLQTGPLSAGTLARLGCDAVVQAALTTRSGAVLHLGRAVRTVTPTQRKALIARDHGCVVPSCTAPIAACDAHHVVWWRHGGRTDLTNLTLLCGQHHTAVHAGIWALTVIDGLPWAVPPRWVDPDQRPVRNRYATAVHRTRTTGHQLRLWHAPPQQPDG